MLPAIFRDQDTAKKLLDTILEGPNGRRSLARLARTCKVVSGQALTALWSELDNMLPLISLFPNEILKKARRPGLGLIRTPQEKDWEKFTKYGALVQRISYDEIIGNVSVTIFPMLEYNRPTPHILPNLQHLNWRSDTAAGLERCTRFLSPNLEALTLEVGARTTQLNSFLANMSKKVHLKSLSYMTPSALPPTFPELVLSQSSIEKLALVAPGALSPKVGRWIAALPNLHNLRLDLSARSLIVTEGFFEEIPTRSGDSTPSSVGSTDSGVFSGEEIDFSDIRKSALQITGDLPSKSSFAGLRHLHLTGDVANIAVFLKHITRPLQSLELVIDDPVDKADWHDLSQLICERYSESLSSLRISATPASKFADLSRSATSATGRLPLDHWTSLPALTRLDIDLPESVLFINQDIARLAEACPNLEEVRLCPAARFPIPSGAPRLTLEGLAPLMRCRNLHTIYAVFDATQGSHEVLTNKEACSESLARLHVGHSWVRDPLHVAILLSHLAPQLETLRWFHERNRPGYIEANAKGWQQVQESLPHLQNMRLAERIFAATPVVIERVVERIVEVVKEVAPPRPPTRSKHVQASPVLIDQGVLARPPVLMKAVQIKPTYAESAVEAKPEEPSPEVMVISDDDESAAPPPARRVSALNIARMFFILPSLLNFFHIAFRGVVYPVTLPYRASTLLIDRMRKTDRSRTTPTRKRSATVSQKSHAANGDSVEMGSRRNSSTDLD